MKFLNTETGELEDLILRAPGNYNPDEVSKQSGLTCPPGSSLTNQADAKDADINEIVRRFGLTGQLPIIQLPPSLDDFSEVFDFQTAMNTIAHANQAFMALPAEARSYFQNDPHRFVAFIDDTLNAADEDIRKGRLAELTKLGLRLPQPPTQEATTPPATPGAATTPSATTTDKNT